MVAIEGGDEQTGKDVAMHIAASVANVRPVCVSRDQVPAELIDKERAIYSAQAAESGKPADIVAKMVEGRINKYLAEVTLLGQPFVEGHRADGRKVSEVEGRDGPRLHALCRRRGHREKKRRFRRGSRGDGEGLKQSLRRTNLP